MNCNKIRDLLSLYIDQMLDEDQVKEVEEHLSTCDSCRKELDEMKEILGLLNQAEMVPVPEAFNFRLKKALKEEKQNMINSGILEKPSKKNQRLRMITSIAAVFAVGVISFGLYHDVLNLLPDKLNGVEQTGTQETEAMPEEQPSEYKLKSDELAKDDSVMMKSELGESPQDEFAGSGAEEEYSSRNSIANADSNVNADSAALADESASSSDTAAEETYGIAAAPNEDGGQTSTGASGTEEALTTDVSDNYGTSVTKKASPEECSRSLTSSGVERNTAAVQYYNNLIEERLDGFDYQVLSSSYAQTGQWKFKIFIFRGKDGNTYNEEILIIGKDGEIEVIYSNEFMGLKK